MHCWYNDNNIITIQSNLYTIRSSFSSVMELTVHAATNYTITYSDPSSGRICGHVTVSASACTNGQCNHVFDIPSACSNLKSIIITVFPSNILGAGPSSEPILLEISKLCYCEKRARHYCSHYCMIELEDAIIHFNASDTTFLYSIVGAGSSVAVILFLLLSILIIALVRFLNRK